MRATAETEQHDSRAGDAHKSHDSQGKVLWALGKPWREVKSGTVAFGLIALTVFCLTVNEFVRSRQSTSIATTDRTIYATPYRPPAGALYAADADPHGDPRLWMAFVSGGRVLLSPWRFEQNRIVADALVAAGRAPRPLTTALIARWRGQEAVVLVSARQNKLHVLVRSLDGSARVLASGTTPRSQFQPSVHRDFGLRLSTGGVPDLVEVDRDPRQPRRVVLRIYTGASDFREQAAYFTTQPGPALDPAGWTAIPASVNISNVDLAFVSIGRETSSHRLEIHVLLGRSTYKMFGEQRALFAPVPQQPTQAVIGHIGTVTLLYVVDPIHDRIQAFPVTW